MIKQEYGSEFTEEEPQGPLNGLFEKEKVYEFLLGRTALDAVISDAVKEYGIKNILLPSYCCHTMIHPFLNRGLHIKFYNVFPQAGAMTYDIAFDEAFDCILVMQYFGFHQPGYFEMLRRLKSMGKVIIEDATHSILQREPYSPDADYVFASYRKWLALKGGAIAIKRRGLLYAGSGMDSPGAGTREKYLTLKQEAVRQKKDYLQKNSHGEKEYLKTFGEAEELIEACYSGMEADEESSRRIRYTDFDRIAKIRRSNAEILAGRLRDVPQIRMVFPRITESDAPLFFPVCLEADARDLLRRYLINKKIYLPVHWPLSSLHDISKSGKKLYSEELSVICDQRYDNGDMEYIASVIAEGSKNEWI